VLRLFLLMDKSFLQCGDVGPFHIEARRIDDQWHWFVENTSNRIRAASGCAPSLEKAKRQAEEVTGKAQWYFVVADDKKSPLPGFRS